MARVQSSRPRPGGPGWDQVLSAKLEKRSGFLQHWSLSLPQLIHLIVKITANLMMAFGFISQSKFFFFNLYLLLRERETDRVRAGKGQREREMQNLKQAPGSELSAQSPKRGWNSQSVRS